MKIFRNLFPLVLPACFGRFAGTKLFQPVFGITGCDLPGVKTTYCSRYRLIEKPDTKEAPGFGLYLHIFHRSDIDTYHCHPWDFTTFPLWGGYVEEVPIVYPLREEDPHTAKYVAETIRRLAGPKSPHYQGEWKDHTDYLYHEGTVVHVVEKGCEDYQPGDVTYWYMIDRVKWRCQRDLARMMNNSRGKHDPLPPGPGVGWEQVYPETPVRLRIWPLTRHYRPAGYVHRVKLRHDRKGREKKAITLVWRGPKQNGGVWGFFLRGKFIDSETFIAEHGGC